MELARDTQINGEYTLGPELGRGGFAVVYLATDRIGRTVAVKTERREKKSALKIESYVYAKVRKDAKRNGGYPKGIPRMLHFSEDFHRHRVLVMECLGKSLGYRLDEQRGPLSLKTVLMIGIQVVSRLEYLHGIGIIHRDIKPGNLLSGTGERQDRIYVSDFGLASAYKDDSGRHLKEAVRHGFCGTYKYSCMQAHRRTRQSRRSDLESLAYTLVYMGTKQLPWMSVRGESEGEYEKEVARIKMKTSAEKLCKGLPRAFIEFVRYVRGLKYDQKPNYERLRKTLGDALEKRGYRNDNQFDWVEVK